MDLDDYFEILGPEEVRIRGSRIGIENVLYEYIHREQSPEAIAARFPSLTLEQVYATILYYLRNRTTVSEYLARWLQQCRQAEEAFDRQPPSVVEKLRRLREEQQGDEVAA